MAAKNDVKALAAQGTLINAIAAATGLCREMVRDALACPDEVEAVGPWADREAEPRPALSSFKYARHSQRVVELRDRDWLAFGEITKIIQEETGESLTTETVRRAYDYGRRLQIAEGDCSAKSIERSRVSLLGPGKLTRMRQLLLDGVPVKAIVQELGCGKSTVFREKTRLAEEGL